MNQELERINWEEAGFFYKSPLALVDYGNMQSFSLIRSSVELFSYYGIVDFTPNDITEFFRKLQLIQKKFDRVFLPSPKKVSGVLDCCLDKGINQLSRHDGQYHIVSWDHSGYGYEISAAHDTGKLPGHSIQ